MQFSQTRRKFAPKFRNLLARIVRKLVKVLFFSRKCSTLEICRTTLNANLTNLHKTFSPKCRKWSSESKRSFETFIAPKKNFLTKFLWIVRMQFDKPAQNVSPKHVTFFSGPKKASENFIVPNEHVFSQTFPLGTYSF